MSSKTKISRRSGCPISIALEMFGDHWSLLIVRDLLFKGFRTFNEFRAAGEGIASNILSDRLARLEREGIVTKETSPEDARRFIYRLTAKGIDLAPVLVEIVLWVSKYADTDAPPEVVREMRSNREKFIINIRKQLKQD
jgi:DNA-binding HxlR family transcriptional regulator